MPPMTWQDYNRFLTVYDPEGLKKIQWQWIGGIVTSFHINVQ
jgi:hypothetical protein